MLPPSIAPGSQGPAARLLARWAGTGLFLVGLVNGTGCGGCGRPSVQDAAVPVASSAIGSEDRVQVVQTLLDNPWVQNAVESTFPRAAADGAASLVVVVPSPLQGASLRAFGHPAQVLSPAEAQAQRPEAYLEVTTVVVSGDRAQVRFRDHAEALAGEATLDRVNGAWRVAKVSGTER